MIARDINADKSKYLIENFDKALQDGWIEVYYQPIIRTSNGAVCDEEALVRWDDPILGVLNAAEFIPILEAVNLIHRLDLYVLEQVLDKMEQQEALGLYIVPTSINISQIDFFSCDIVKEFKKRVSASSIPADKIAIEISAGSIGYINEQVVSSLKRFADEGFKIWMDDYGYGETSPAVLQELHFDLLKINMFYTSQICSNPKTRILVAELIRMAIALGVETVAECIETVDQIDFFEEVGCTKLQGFYFCKPISREKIFERYKSGKAIGFENPKETKYYESVGKINLYDLSFTKDDVEDDTKTSYFDTIPAAIVEVNEESLRFIRQNKSFREFMDYNNPRFKTGLEYVFKDNENQAGYYGMNAVRVCGRTGEKCIIDDVTSTGVSIQMLLKCIAKNEVKNVSAVAIVLLSVNSGARSNDILTYNYIARALSEDYVYLYLVNGETDEFVEYRTNRVDMDVAIERKGSDFWNTSLRAAKTTIYKDDQDIFANNFIKENVLKHIDEQGSFKMAYRLLDEEKGYIYVSLKAVKVRGSNNLIIGVNDVDEQMRIKEEMDRIKEERLAFARINALSGDFISIYTVNPKDNSYKMYKSSKEYEKLELASEGKDFFEEARERSKRVIYNEDLDGYLKIFDRNTVLEHIFNTGIFVYNYRISIDGMPKYVCLKAAIVKENDEPKLIVGVIDVDHQVRKELEYAENLLRAENRATRDALTGVKNKRAYVDAEKILDDVLHNYPETKIAVAVCDINGLKETNDTLGHQAGDEYIKSGCNMICNIFSHSPVYRIGGDEFVVVIQGQDYERLDSLIERMEAINVANSLEKKVTVAIGVSKNMTDTYISDIFKRADEKMYKNKARMKREYVENQSE